jgi:H+/gluconate symporter-like permease
VGSFIRRKINSRRNELFPSVWRSEPSYSGTSPLPAIYFTGGNIEAGSSMMHSQNGEKHSENSQRRVRSPVVVAAIVAVVGLVAMLVVDHGPWSRPHMQTAEVAGHKNTAEAARAVGATVTPTAPTSELDPVAPGPKRAQPVNPAP